MSPLSALSHEVSAMLATAPAGDATRFEAMALCKRLIEYSDTQRDDDIRFMLRSWIGRIQDRHLS